MFTGIYPTDSCVYIKGVMTDTLFRDGVFWAKTSLDGSILSLTEIVETKKAYNSWTPKIKKNKKGNFVFGGTADDGIRKGFIIELSPEGKTLKYKEFVSPLYPTHPFIAVSSVLPLPNGGYVASGNLTNVTQENTLYAKFDDDFNLLFSKALGTTKFYETVLSTAIDNQNHILLGGWEFRQSIEKNIVSRKTITRLDSLGENITFQWKWPQADFPKWRGWSVYEMLVEPDGSIIGASAITEEISWSNPMYAELWEYPTLFKLNPDYSMAWETRIDFPPYSQTGENVRVVKANDDKGYVVAGTLDRVEKLNAQGEIVNPYKIFGLISKVGNDGKITWARYLSFFTDTTSEYHHKVHDFAAAPGGGYWLCGEVTRSLPNEPLQQGWLVRVDDYGCLSPGCHLVGTEDTPTLEDNITVYPNPASEYIVVHHAGHEFLKGRFRIVDMQGRTVQDWAAVVNDMSTVFDVSHYPSGNYVLQYSEGGQMLVARQFAVSR